MIALMVDAVMAAVLLEAAGLLLLHRLGGLVWNLAAGFSLLVAMRLAVGDTGWPWIATALLAALASHLADLRQRWSR